MAGPGGTINLTNGNDIFPGGFDDNSGNETINGLAGDDIIEGGLGNDAIYGGAGNDQLSDSAGATGIMDGGAGADLILLGTGLAAGTLIGGSDIDTLRLAPATFNLTPFSISGIEILELPEGSVTATAAQLNGFSTIRRSAADPAGLVAITIAGVGSPQTADFSGKLNGGSYITASDDTETIIGSAFRDIIHSNAGNDTIYGGGGDDDMSTFFGNTNLFGGDGNDNLYSQGLVLNYDCGEGDDSARINRNPTSGTVAGGPGDDSLGVAAYMYSIAQLNVSGFEKLTTNYATHLSATAAQLESFDRIFVDYTFFGTAPRVLLQLADTGAAQTLDLLDELTIGGPARSVEVYGSSSADTITTGNLDDTITGGDGNDVLKGGLGIDTVSGDGGDDALIASADGAADTYDGGAGGGDILDIYAATSGATVTFGATPFAGTATGGGLGGDSFTGIERIYGSAFNDVVTGGSGGEFLYTRAGNDIVYGGGGDDLIYGGDGADFLRDGTGLDSVNGGEGNDVILIDADGVADTVNGAGGAADALDLGLASGPTNVTFGATLFAGAVTGGFMGTTSFSGIECVYGSNAFADFMYGGAGGEYLYSRGGDDFLVGGGGSDIIDGGAGTDSLFGGAGDDLFDFDPGSGQDNIYDFTDNVDTLRFDPAYGFATAQDVVNATVAVGNHALILLPGNLGVYLVNYLVSNTISSLLDDIIIG